jgi:hypothetical protein
MQPAEVALSVLQSLESPVPGKRARRVWWEAAWKRPEFMRNEHGTSPGSPPYVRHEAHCYIARSAGRDERRYLWI